MTPGPDWRKCTAYHRSGPGGMPLALRLIEGLGAAGTAVEFLGSWWKVPPRRDNKQPKHGVYEREDPERCLVVQNLLNPMRNKACTVRSLARLLAQPRLQDGERTEPAKPSLGYNDTDCDDVRDTEQRRIDPMPVSHVAYEHEAQTAHDKHDYREVRQQHCICK